MFTCANRVAARPQRRRGTIATLIAFTMVVLISFLGLAIDLGMLAIAKTQTQQAADLAALTAARTLNGIAATSYNSSAATANAQNILTYNKILGANFLKAQVTLTYGSYDYSQSTQAFTANFPALTGSAYTAVSSSVTTTNLKGAFSTVFGSQFLPNVTATAQAVHRPRDIALAMDLSGSMRFGSLLGFDFYTSTRTSNNPDPLVPIWSHYSGSNSGLVGPSTTQTSGEDSYLIPPSNITVPNSSYNLTYINSFYQNDAYASTLVRAFDSSTSTDGGITWTAATGGATPVLPPTTYATTPGGDVPLFTKGSTSSYATTVNDFTGSTTRNVWWELDGYSGTTSGKFNNADLGTKSYPSTGAGSFTGYTKGPGYYGKTFFIWPPDPRTPLYTGKNSGWSTSTQDAAQIYQFLQDFGFVASTDQANNAFTTTLAAAINNSQTTITVKSYTPFPTSGSGKFRILINSSEIMLVTPVNATTWTVQRGMDGTAKLAASTNATVALVTAPPLCGICNAANTNITGLSNYSGLDGETPATSQVWPWPNDGGTTLGTYLTTNVYAPVSVASTARLLLTTDAAYLRIMRLYNSNYVIDNLGTTSCDWRVRFFGTDDNTKLFTTSSTYLGLLAIPGSSTYTINYNEILRWLTQTTDPFPTQLRSGRIKYYGSIPTAITGSWPNYGSTDQRFWVEFIDYVLGFKQTAAGIYTEVYAMSGYGSDFTWGTTAITAEPAAGTTYMSYKDNPARPNLRYWFSPIMLVDFLHNYNTNSNLGANYFFMQPANSYEAPLYSGKQAFVAAVNAMQSNHPNDWVTIAPYSWPRSASSGVASGTGSNGRFNCVSCPLGNNYNYATSSLLFPFSTINADGSCNNTEVTPYDADPATGLIPSANFVDTPRSDGDTCFAMGLMLAFNQFAITPSTDTTLRTFVTSSPITFPTGMAGGMGRKGAQKVIIFETDGLANCTATASLITAAGGYQYYQIRYDMNKPSTSEYPSISPLDINNTTVLTQVYALVTQLQATYGSTRNPFRLYAIGFGPVFGSTSANQSGALSTLQSMQYYAGTQSSASTPLPSTQIITGTDTQILANMTAAYTTILQSGVQIALIK